jgi:hypothetical protein
MARVRLPEESKAFSITLRARTALRSSQLLSNEYGRPVQDERGRGRNLTNQLIVPGPRTWSYTPSTPNRASWLLGVSLIMRGDKFTYVQDLKSSQPWLRNLLFTEIQLRVDR